ncbi:MAG: histidine kinase, partial [Gemmatimonadota bacterium]
TDSTLWQLDSPDARPRERLASPVTDVHPLTDGRLLVLTRDGGIVELGADADGTAAGAASADADASDADRADTAAGVGRVRVLASRAAGDIPPSRPIAITERNGEVWAAFDRYLVSVRPGRPPEVITPSDGFEAGGPIFVDREGSLWLGSFAALFQYPEPATTLWNDRHGLPSRHTRYLARVGDRIWVTTWQGAGLMRGAERGAVRTEHTGLGTRTRPCVDATGAVWMATTAGHVRVRGDRVVSRGPSPAAFNACGAEDDDGGLWIGTSRGLYRADADAGTLRPVEDTPFGREDPVTAVLRDRRGGLWAAGGERICRADAAAPLEAGDGGAERGAGEFEAGAGESNSGARARWRCDEVPGAAAVVALLELDDGGVWAATRRSGLLTYRAGRGWRPLAGNDELASRDVFALVPSPSEGVWIVGHGILLRVRARADGWEVLERPGAWHGLPATGGADLLEQEDGTLWIATSLGLLRIAPRARFSTREPPGVALVDARVDAEPVPLAPGLELPADRNRLELRFAALSFRDRAAIRYQVRLGPGSPWVDTRGEASFRWVDLPAGRYDAEVRASLDGRRWSAEPARFTFDVLPPWYRTGWALGLFAGLAVALLWAAYRARVAFLLGPERQRTRIAMDLHDELGSGLGSVGILASLLAGRRLDDADRRRFAREIVGTAEQLGTTLSDIVWSLEPRTATLEELAARLAGHGERLFAGGGVEFVFLGPSAWPETRLPLPARRNILMIGLEALHNAARHARAGRVTLSIRRRGGDWILSVADDGVGLGPAGDEGGAGGGERGDGRAPGESVDERRGRRPRGMRRRADQIGATLDWTSPADGRGRGTAVTLRFRIGAT